MRIKKQAGSQAGWALICGQVNAARVEAHRIHQLLNKVLAIVDKSSHRDHIYQVAGDLIEVIPRRLENLETDLDTAGYALSKMGEDHLKDRLPVSSRALVDETVEGAKAFGAGMQHESMVDRITVAYLARHPR
jgi:hypothetical protein